MYIYTHLKHICVCIFTCFEWAFEVSTWKITLFTNLKYLYSICMSISTSISKKIEYHYIIYIYIYIGIYIYLYIYIYILRPTKDHLLWSCWYLLGDSMIQTHVSGIIS